MSNEPMDLDDHEVMFTWTDDRSLVIELIGADGSLVQYEMDPSEIRSLFNFLKEKMEPIEKITKVLGTIADNKLTDK